MRKKTRPRILVLAAALLLSAVTTADAKKPAPNPCVTACAQVFFTNVQTCGLDAACLQSAYDQFLTCSLSCPR